MNILIIEDDKSLGELMKSYLVKEGFCVSLLFSGKDATESIIMQQPDLVILDVMLPEKNGILICQEIRECFSGIVLMLTANHNESSQISGLEKGADDYLYKPIKPQLLLAKINSLLRRKPHKVQKNKLVCGDLLIDSISREAYLKNQILALTDIEFELLATLAQNSGKIVSRDYLSRVVYGRDYDGVDRSIDNAISQIRKKINDNARHPAKIKTVRSKGYLLVSDL